MIRVGIVGYGRAAQIFHVPLLQNHPAFTIRAVVSRQSALDLSPFPHAKQFPDLDSALAAKAFDLAVITTPNQLHYAQAKQCLLHDVAVVLEKPMATRLDEACALQTLAQERGVLLNVFHNRRFDGDFLTVQRLLQQSALGDIQVFRSHWDRFRPTVQTRWRESAEEGAGIWFDLAPHLLDQALCLFGLPEAVSARLRILRTGGLSDDYAHVQLHYPKHEVILHTSPFQSAPNPRFHVEGSTGTFVKYGLDVQEEQLKAGMSPHDAHYGEDRPEHYGIIYRAEQAPCVIPTVRGQFPHYYEHIAHAFYHPQHALPISLDDAVNTMRVLTLAQESALQQRTLFFTS